MPNYSTEKNVQILISLMKQHEIKKIIVSPGMKNLPVIASVQFDSYFEVYSCVDERSAAYMATGLAVESGEPVALSCTGATASRNYLSALTEAYYRNIPILAITSMSHLGEIGHLIPQVLDRRAKLNDTVRMSVQIDSVHTKKDEWDANVKINTALLELRHNNGGPVHIELICENFSNFTDKLIKARKITRYNYESEFPKIKSDRVAIFIGAHRWFDDKLTDIIDQFCGIYNAVVICDNTSNYYGKYRVQPSLLNVQVQKRSNMFNIDLLIHIGDVSGSYISINAKRTWRVNPDGMVRDTFKSMESIFEMSESYFFNHYANLLDTCEKCNSYLQEWQQACKEVQVYNLSLPFSNAWIASKVEPNLPNNSVLYLGILNSLRNWNFFEINRIPCYSNTGGFGIDGAISTLLGAAIANKNKIFYLVLGDLAFFYDMNSLGNRDFPNNVRIILVNNGKGVEFRNYQHPSAVFESSADQFMAAAGHFGKQSYELVKNYSQNLGFMYYSASSKEEFAVLEDRILAPMIYDKPILIEAFTSAEDESKALEMISNIIHDVNPKQIAKNILGDSGIRKAKRILQRK